MKSTRTFEKEKSYPVLKSRIDGGHGNLTVLFSSENTGTVVFCENNSHPIGYFTQRWPEAEFEETTACVTLQN